MTDQNWDNFGEEIKNRVDQAIRHGDFTDLSRSVGDIINGTIESVRETAQNGHYQRTYSTQKVAYKSTNNSQKMHVRDAGQPQSQLPALYQTTPPGKISGILMCAAGYTGVVVSGGLLIGLGVIAIFGKVFPMAIGMLAVLALVCLVVAVGGTKKLGLANRFQRYVRLISRQMYVQIPMLAEKTNRSVEYVTRDLKKMIADRMFFQAHIDEDGSCLILSDQAYREYTTAKIGYQSRQRAAEEEARTRAALSPECRKLIEDGEAYIKHIHQCNEELPGEEISAKLDQMERVVSRIFSVVQEHPEVAPELQKMMSYYLPTTKKLLDAYLEMERQPVAGENISTTKREIEGTIDTLNVAFEKLLDGLFVDKAWDISSDISVLNTVLAQDGLKDDDLKKKMNS